MASRTLTLTQALNRAVSAYKAGKLVEAEQICQQIISAKNDLFDAQYLLAVAQSSLGKNDLALASFDKALALKPDCAQAYYNRGVSLQDLNRLNEAVASFDKALALDPSHAEAFNNRGNALKDLDRHEEALGSFDRALSVRQDYVKALYNRGVTLQELSRFDEALASFDKGLAVQPDYAEAFNNRGVALKELKRLDEALTSFDKALAVSPEYAQAHYNRGVILQELNRIEEALASFDKAFALNPHLAEAVNNRGVALMKLKRLDEALASFGEALALKPDYADAFYNRGIILQELARFDEALASYEHALAVKPNHTRAFSGTVDCLNKLCDWRRTSNIADDVIAHVLEKKSIISPFALLGYSGDPLLQLQCARNFVADRVPSLLRPLWTGARWRHDKLRVAYLSADFRSHPVSYLTAGLFEQHDRSRFEIIGISFGVDDRSEMRQRLIAAFDEFHDVRRKSDEEVAKLLHDRQIDIAIDLMGYTQESRPGIFAYRPAPIQASYLGFPGTMGAEFIDYIIADKTVAPFEHQSYYTEKIVHLPDCFQVNDSKRKIAAHTPTREEAGLPAEGFVFCCFNNNWKITPTIFDVWMRLLSAVEGSVLWLSQANDAAVRNLRREADARGIETSRLVFAPRVLRLDDHLARHRLADLFLDTLPYNAHTTASDALWAGLPVVTRLGDAFAGRVAASLLCAVGVPELITSSLEEYQALALKLARDPALMVEIRTKLARNRNTYPLFNTARFARHIEAAYTTMWEIWQRGEQPRSFAVERERTQPSARQDLPSLPEMLKQAVAFHQKGELSEAESLYLQILKARPDHFDALHLLGVLRHQQGRHTEALELIETALKINPKVTHVLLSYGTVLDELKRYAEAIAAYDKALEIKPDDAETLYCRATTLNKLKRHEEALASYDKALAIRPQYAEALYNRGNALNDLKRYEEALASYDRALAVRPGYVKALVNRGVSLQELKRLDEAMASFDRVLTARPDYAKAYCNRGSLLMEMKRADEALASYDKAITLKPDYAEAFYSRAIALQALRRFDEAMTSYDKAIAIKSDYADAFYNRAIALQALRRFDEALASYDKAIAIKPDYAEAFYNRAIVLQELQRFDEALASYGKAIALKPDFPEAQFAQCMAELRVLYMDAPEIIRQRAAYEARLRALCNDVDRRRKPGDLAEGVGCHQPFYLPYQGYNDRDLQSVYGSLVCRIMADRYPRVTLTRPPALGEPVRVGIVSGFFCRHSNWKIPIKGWLSRLDHQKFQVFGYYTGSTKDAETAAAAALCDRFAQGPMSIDRWRQIILGDAAHVLIYPEVGMDPDSARLAAQRLAPVQCNSWGHPNTSGFPTLDYYLSSELMEPPDSQDHYTERLVRLPNLSIYYDPIDSQPIPLGRRDLGLRQTATVYWCGQMLAKYLPQFDSIYPRIAKEVGDCQFVFIQWTPQLNELFQKRVSQAFAAYGLSASDHCVFLPHLNPHQFIAAMGASEIVLDSIGWSGSNSTLESLAHDLPIVAISGALMRGRHTVAILTMMGVTETIANTVDEYISTAVRLARDESWRTAVRRKIAQHKHRVYRDKTCIIALEEFLDRVARSAVK